MRLYIVTLLGISILALKLAASASQSGSPSCPPGQRDALLRFKNSFSIVPPISDAPFDACNNISYPRTASWRGDVDCCSWDGVTCDRLTGDVIGLDLSCIRLQGVISSNSTLFSLPRLRRLNLAGNYFLDSSVPPEMSVFEGMTHLNLSASSFGGTIPAELSRLSKLVSLDLSKNFLEMRNPTIRMLAANLTKLEELDLAYSDMTAVTHTSLMNFSASLTSLSFYYCWMPGKFPDYIFQLPNLRKLDLSWNPLNVTLPESNWSSHLAFLSLAYCSFSGEIPLSIGNLRQLTYLDLSQNNFTGHVDFEKLSSLKNLRFLGLSGLSVSGEYSVDANHKLPKLETLDISSGTLMNFPCFLSRTPELRELKLEDGVLAEAQGQCDDEGVVLPQLEELYMGNCSLKKFPSFLSQSKKLRELYLTGNMIKEFPSWFWSIGINTLELLNVRDNLIQGGVRLPWKMLTHLILRNNSFDGSLPTPAQSIQYFDASLNRFSGSITQSICQLTSLYWLDLAGNNLTGIIPGCFGDLTALSNLDLSNNSLTGPLPRSLVNCKSLQSLDVGHNNLNGSPAVRLPMGSLIGLSLQDNFFEGRWPIDIFLRSKSLGIIDLSSNKFEGTPPHPPLDINKYSISSNNFSGEISSFICNATVLRFLDMSNNSLTGTLPKCLKNVATGLIFLNLRMNKLHGVIPEIFSDSSHLGFIDFSRNQFEGSLPRSLLNCSELELLNVRSNRIADSFPHWLQALPLKVLSLKSNKFYGGLNNSEGNIRFSELRVLDLSNNEFDSRLPDNLIVELSAIMRVDNVSGVRDGSEAYYKARRYLEREFYSLEINLKGKETEMVRINAWFATLDLSSNHFYGELPGNIGLLKSLKGLNLSHNRLTGSIPPSLGNLTYLDSLDLSSNLLVGEIPKELMDLSFLGVLNLSENYLTGAIPTGGHFDTFPNSSFEGNPGLCGFPLTRKCGKGISPPSPDPDNNGEDGPWSWFDWKFVAAGFGSGMVIGISLGYMALETGRPLWLARMALRLEAKCRIKPKTKGSRRNGLRTRM